MKDATMDTNETTQQLTWHVESIRDMLERQISGDHYDDECVPLSVDIAYTLEVVYGTGGPHLEAQVPMVRGSYGWEPARYGAHIVGWWGSEKVTLPLAQEIAAMLVEQYA
jgi:hypothetical protein